MYLLFIFVHISLIKTFSKDEAHEDSFIYSTVDEVCVVRWISLLCYSFLNADLVWNMYKCIIYRVILTLNFFYYNFSTRYSKSNLCRNLFFFKSNQIFLCRFLTKWFFFENVNVFKKRFYNNIKHVILDLAFIIVEHIYKLYNVDGLILIIYLYFSVIIIPTLYQGPWTYILGIQC